MKPTKESNNLMSFFFKHNCLIPLSQTAKTKMLFKKFYKEINDGVSYIENVKSKLGNSFYKLKIDHISNIIHVPKPTTFCVLFETVSASLIIPKYG